MVIKDYITGLLYLLFYTFLQYIIFTKKKFAVQQYSMLLQQPHTACVYHVS